MIKRGQRHTNLAISAQVNMRHDWEDIVIKKGMKTPLKTMQSSPLSSITPIQAVNEHDRS